MTTYNQEYFVGELIKYGKIIEPDKYTEQYCATLYKIWLNQPVTRLHLKVLERKKQAELAQAKQFNT